MTFKTSAIVAAFCALIFISGCGQRGPLYLPKLPTPAIDVKAAPVSSNTPTEVGADTSSALPATPTALP